MSGRHIRCGHLASGGQCKLLIVKALSVLLGLQFAGSRAHDCVGSQLLLT